MKEVTNVRRPTWAVVATVDEPPVLISAFVRHHLAIGAKEVHIYLDRPNPVAQADIEPLEGCTVTVCDDAYWERTNHGHRRPRPTGRQQHNADEAFAKTKCDWMLHCDADEFIANGADLQADLEAESALLDYLHIRNIERVYVPGSSAGNIFEGLFRSKNAEHDLMGEGIYGTYAKYLRDGLTGHGEGKSIVRRKAQATMGVHRPLPLQEGQSLEVKRCMKTRLLHFDGMTPLHFALKLIRRSLPKYSGPKRFYGDHRAEQIRHVCENATNPEAIMDLVVGVQSLTKSQLDLMGALSQINYNRFALQGCENLDLSVGTFDAELREVHSELLEETGLSLSK